MVRRHVLRRAVRRLADQHARHAERARAGDVVQHRIADEYDGARIRIPAWPGDAAPAKVAAIGVKVDARGVSRHGFALNLATDMSYWEGIIACGIEEYRVINLGDLLETPPDMAQVSAAVVQAFGEATLEVLKNDPHRVAETISGITLNRAQTISRILQEQEEMEATIIELESLLGGHRIPKQTIPALVKLFGSDAPARIRRDP